MALRESRSGPLPVRGCESSQGSWLRFASDQAWQRLDPIDCDPAHRGPCRPPRGLRLRPAPVRLTLDQHLGSRASPRSSAPASHLSPSSNLPAHERSLALGRTGAPWQRRRGRAYYRRNTPRAFGRPRPQQLSIVRTSGRIPARRIGDELPRELPREFRWRHCGDRGAYRGVQRQNSAPAEFYTATPSG